MSNYVKAISAFFGLLGTWGATAAADGKYDQMELWGITGIFVGTFAVFQFPNKEKPRRRRRRPKPKPAPDAGHATVLTVLGILAIVLVALILAEHTQF